MARILRLAGYRLVEVKAHSRDGDLTILYAEIPRRQTKNLAQKALAVDGNCFCIINNVNVAQSAARRSLSRRPQKDDLLSMKRGI